MGTEKNELDNWRERFFGWLPKNRAGGIFFVLNILYFVYCCFGWRRLPSVMVFGWWPLNAFVFIVIMATVGAVLWGIYYQKFWHELDNDKE